MKSCGVEVSGPLHPGRDGRCATRLRAMNVPLGAFAVAERLIGKSTLSAGQLAQLRAIDHAYQQSLYTMLRGEQRAPTSEEIARLDAAAERSILEMMTP